MSEKLPRRRFLKAIGGGTAATVVAGCSGGGDGDTTTEPPAEDGDTPMSTPTQTDTPAPGDGSTPTDTPGGEETPTPTATPGNQVDLDSVTIANPSPHGGILEMPTYVSLRHVFEQDNVGYGTQVYSGYVSQASGILRGDVDAAFMTLPAVARARDQGLPLQILAGAFQAYGMGLVVSDEIEEWEDLRGGEIITHQPLSMTTACAQVMIDEELGSPDAASIDFIPVGPNRLAALEAGEINATILADCEVSKAVTDGIGRPLSLGYDYDRLTEQIAGAWVHLGTELEEESTSQRVGAIMDHVFQAYEQTYDWSLDEITNQVVSSDNTDPYNAETWRRALDRAQQNRLWGPTLTEERFTKSQDVLLDTGLLEEGQEMSFDEVVDRRYLE